jgi:hypothetical protein
MYSVLEAGNRYLSAAVLSDVRDNVRPGGRCVNLKLARRIRGELGWPVGELRAAFDQTATLRGLGVS